MSVSDPFIKDLKGWTRKLTEHAVEIEDDNSDLASFCKSLERCFQKGILIRMNAIGFPKLPESWYWMEEILNKNKSYAYTSAVEAVKENCRVRSPLGRLRLLIRISLVRKCLHIPVQILVQNDNPSLALDYYEPRSILGDEILREILLSVLLQVGRLNFKLNLKNCCFLDDTWQLPECSTLELVPCKVLGISVSFIEGKALIVNLEENSVAAEDEKIELGDILDEINGNVITSSVRGKLGKIMKKSIGRPISIRIVKFRSRQPRDFYGPIIHMIRNSGIEHMKNMLLKSADQIKSEEETDDKKSVKADSEGKNNHLKAGFVIKYCGLITTGAEGDVRQIEKAIWQIIRSGDSQLIDVRFECLEIGIRVTQDIDDNVISKHSYMEISSCGRTVNIPDYFAYIAGDKNCSVATNFTAYVFYHKNEDEVQTILQSLGQGFQRTHFAV